MEHGDFVSQWYEYVGTKTGVNELVCWKDRDIVYCITNWTATNKIGSWFHIIQLGVIKIYMSKVICDYNDIVGGVGIEDTRRQN